MLWECARCGTEHPTSENQCEVCGLTYDKSEEISAKRLADKSLKSEKSVIPTSSLSVTSVVRKDSHADVSDIMETPSPKSASVSRIPVGILVFLVILFGVYILGNLNSSGENEFDALQNTVIATDLSTPIGVAVTNSQTQSTMTPNSQTVVLIYTSTATSLHTAGVMPTRTPSATSTRIPSATPTRTPSATTTRTPSATTVPRNANLLIGGIGLSDGSYMTNGEFQVEYYCTDQGWGINHNNQDWYCVNRNNTRVYTLVQQDFDQICQETYNNSTAFAQQISSNQIRAFNWRCFGFSNNNTNSYTTTGSVNTTRLNVRRGPGPEYTEVTQLTEGTQITIIGRNTDSTWVQISGSGQRWVSADYIRINGSISRLPITFEEVGGWQNARNTTGVRGRVTETLRIRGGPGINFQQLRDPDTLEDGDVVDIVGRNSGGDWYRVNIGRRSAWVSSAYVTIISGSLANVPIER